LARKVHKPGLAGCGEAERLSLSREKHQGTIQNIEAQAAAKKG
jgi:hypothetical protein